MKFWPILLDFTMTSYLLFSNHATMVANFEKLLISLSFLLNFRKLTKFERVILKALRIMEENCGGSLKTPGPNRVKNECFLLSFIGGGGGGGVTFLCMWTYQISRIHCRREIFHIFHGRKVIHVTPRKMCNRR